MATLDLDGALTLSRLVRDGSLSASAALDLCARVRARRAEEQAALLRRVSHGLASEWTTSSAVIESASTTAGGAVEVATSATSTASRPVWHDPAGEFEYAIVTADRVRTDVVEATQLGRRFASLHLGIEPPALDYFVPAERALSTDGPSFWGRDCGGLASRLSHRIACRADSDPEFAVEVAAHETRHVWQTLSLGERRDEAEDDALAYGVWAHGVLRSSGGPTRAVHVVDGFPSRGSTLAGIANANDVLIARDNGRTLVFRNLGSRQHPSWTEHSSVCPVPVGRAA